MLGKREAGNHKGNGKLGIIISQSFPVPRDFYLSLKHAPDTALKCWDVLSFKEVHLCKIHYSLVNQKKPPKNKEAIILKGGVQKTEALILGEQRYHGALQIISLWRKDSHPSNSKAQGNISPYTKESEFKMWKHLINWNLTSRGCCPFWSKTYVKRYSEHVVSISLN